MWTPISVTHGSSCHGPSALPAFSLSIATIMLSDSIVCLSDRVLTARILNLLTSSVCSTFTICTHLGWQGCRVVGNSGAGHSFRAFLSDSNCPTGSLNPLPVYVATGEKLGSGEGHSWAGCHRALNSPWHASPAFPSQTHPWGALYTPWH